MKTILKVLLFITTLCASSQDTEIYKMIGIGVDPRNLFVGSDTNDAGLDIMIKVIGGDYLPKTHIAIEGGLLYESFSLIDYQNYAFFSNVVFSPFRKNYNFLKHITIAAGPEYGIIQRFSNSSFMTYGGNLELRYDIKRFVISFQGNVERRDDIAFFWPQSTKEWVFSTYFNVYFRLD